MVRREAPKFYKFMKQAMDEHYTTVVKEIYKRSTIHHREEDKNLMKTNKNLMKTNTLMNLIIPLVRDISCV